LTDLDHEPHYSANYLERWETWDGCTLRLDVITTRHGGCIDGVDNAGRQVSRTDPAGVVTTRHYNQAGRADSETIAKGSTIASFDYTFDPVGNVQQIVQTVPSPNTDSGTWDYTCDDQNRLLTASVGLRLLQASGGSPRTSLLAHIIRDTVS
jgi:YD repeat-containing protein